MKNFRDIEQLSSYLDGQLSPSESAQLESRLSSDPELASAFNDIRAARSTLRKLPARKAPRNFTLTRQMVGLKPPLPRSYSFFRFSTALATILLIFTFAANALTQLPRASFSAAAPLAPVAQGAYGLGGGPASTSVPAAAAAPAAAAPAATQAPMAAAPSMENAVAPTQESLPTVSADMAATEAPAAKAAGTASVPPPVQSRINEKREAVVPVAWQIGLLVVGLVSLLIMLALRQSAKQKWK